MKRLCLSGRKFGSLKVISFSHINSCGKTTWNCVCKCGAALKCGGSDLKNGHTVSCGCGKIKLPPGEASFRFLLTTYRWLAKKKGRAFSLSAAQFKALTKGNCTYCGEPPAQVANQGKSEYVYNGVDRVDSSKGYTKSNAVSCCGICNKAKLNMSVEHFMEWISRLVKYQTQEKTQWKK